MPPLSRRSFFEGAFCQAKCHVAAQSQGYHLVCIWGSYIKFQGGEEGWAGLKDPALCYTRFEEFLYQYLSLSYKASCLPEIEGGLCLAWCQVVAKTHGYHLVFIWGSYIKFQGRRWAGLR